VVLNNIIFCAKDICSITSLTLHNPLYGCVGKNKSSRREFYISVLKEFYRALVILRTNMAL